MLSFLDLSCFTSQKRAFSCGINLIASKYNRGSKAGFKKIVVRYKKIGYNINVMRQMACLVVNPIKVNSFAYLFNCTTVGRTSD